MFGYNPNDFAADFHRMRTESIVRRHSHPQSIFTHCDGKLMVDKIYRFENITEDFEKLCKTINLDGLPLGKKNTTKHKHWSNVFNRKTINFVNKFYGEDFENFGYNMI
jgi:hypothetical protein